MKVDAEIQPLIDLAKTYEGSGINKGKGPFRLAPGGKHMKLIDDKGRRVLDAEGKPIIVSGSPSEARNRDLMVNRWMNAGLIPYDPWKPKSEKKEETRDEKLEREKRERIEEGKEEQRVTSGLSMSARTRLLPLLGRLPGGWDEALNRQLGTVMYRFARHRKLAAAIEWGSEDYAYRSAVNLKRGGTISPEAATAWEMFAQELEDAEKAGTPLLRRWNELVEEAATATPSATAVLAAARREAMRPAEPVHPPSAALEPGPEHTLANGVGHVWLQVFYEMARGQDGSEEARKRVFILALEVKRLERGET
jgi:hypothetical protein